MKGSLVETGSGRKESGDVSTLQDISKKIVALAQSQEFVVPREIREHLAEAGLDEEQWQEVVSLAGAALRYRSGRYYYQDGRGRRQQDQEQQKSIEEAVHQLVAEYQEAENKVERREKNRIPFVQPVIVRTEDGGSLRLLTRDLSSNGTRLVGTYRLLGQKVEVVIHKPVVPGQALSEEGGWIFLVRILWTCEIGDGLYENGGSFLELVAPA